MARWHASVLLVFAIGVFIGPTACGSSTKDQPKAAAGEGGANEGGAGTIPGMIIGGGGAGNTTLAVPCTSDKTCADFEQLCDDDRSICVDCRSDADRKGDTSCTKDV